MAKHTIWNASVLLNGVDVSDHVQSVSFAVGNNFQPAAAMGERDDYDMVTTRKISPITVTMFQDFAASETYATLMPLHQAQSTFPCVIKPDAGATSPTNPAWTVQVFIAEFPIFSGGRGDLNVTTVTLQPASVLTIATA